MDRRYDELRRKEQRNQTLTVIGIMVAGGAVVLVSLLVLLGGFH